MRLSTIATMTTVDDYGIDEGDVGGERRGQEAGGGWRVAGGVIDGGDGGGRGGGHDAERRRDGRVSGLSEVK